MVPVPCHVASGSGFRGFHAPDPAQFASIKIKIVPIRVE